MKVQDHPPTHTHMNTYTHPANVPVPPSRKGLELTTLGRVGARVSE